MSGRIQTGLPALSVISSPSGALPLLGVRNMKPGATLPTGATTSIGGALRSGLDLYWRRATGVAELSPAAAGGAAAPLALGVAGEHASRTTAPSRGGSDDREAAGRQEPATSELGPDVTGIPHRAGV